jgi:hypothetical protein
VVTARQGEKSWSAATDENGAFLLADLPAGTVTVQVQMFGFQPFSKEVKAEERGAAAEFALSLRPYRPAAPRSPAPAQRQEEAAVATPAEDLAVAAPVMADPAEASESFLVQGSMSRGLSQPASPEGMDFGALRMSFGMGGGGPEGGPPGNSPGAPGFGGAPGAPAGGGGMPGMAGMPMGGPGGAPGGFGGRAGPGGGPGGGFGGPGGRGGPGGLPGGITREQIANMTPEQRERMRRMIEQRMRERGVSEGFGNRSRRVRDQIHGGVNLSVRNSIFDATPYSVNGRAVEKPDYSQYRYGATIGGPLQWGSAFPANRTFFFVNFMGGQGDNPYSGFAVMPDALMRAGDFSQMTSRSAIIFDPLAGVPFAGNRIPASRFSEQSSGLLKLIPLPNVLGATQNYKFITAIPQNSENVSVRLNRTFSAKDRLAYSMSLQWRSSIGQQLYGFQDDIEGTGASHDLTWNHNFTAKLILNVRARYNSNRNTTVPYFAFGPDISGQLGIQGNSRYPANFGPPNLNFTNYGDLTDANFSLRRTHTYGYGTGWTIVMGKHSLQTGFDFTRTQLNTVAEQNARGTLFFGGLATSGFDAQGQPLRGTGLDFADYLLGYPQQSTIRFGGADTYMRQSTYSLFAQDEWRLRRDFTLNLGVRYEIWNPFTEKYGRLANLDLAPGFTAAAVVTPGSTGPWQGAVPDGLVRADRNNIAPRLGLAWRPTRKRAIVVRAGYSLFYDGSVFSRLPGRLGWQPPFATSAQFNTSTGTPLVMSNPFTGPEDVTIRNTNAVNPNLRTPYAQTWNFAISQPLPFGLTLETGYLGTKGTALLVQRMPNRAAPGSPATSEDRRPIPYALGFTYDSPEANSIFHAAQVRLMSRMRRGLSFTALYTFGRSIDNASTIGGTGNLVVQDDNNLRAERGLSNFDRRHTVNLNGFLTSPFGPRGQFLKQNTLASKLLREWSMTFGINAHTGGPLTARVLGSAADAAGTGATGSARASATGLPIQSANGGYFNALAFRVPDAGTYGTAGRNTIPGPGMVAVNASFGRGFTIGGNERRRLDLRAEASNVINHVNLTGYGTVVNAANYGLATNAGDMRSLQFSARFRF